MSSGLLARGDKIFLTIHFYFYTRTHFLKVYLIFVLDVREKKKNGTNSLGSIRKGAYVSSADGKKER